MAEGSGMVAVVRARRDAGLAVTLLDGGRQYTLMPDEGKPSPPPQVHIAPRIPSPAGLPARLHLPGCQTHHNQSSMTSAPNPQARQQRDSSETVEPPRCDSGAQATDGRYASMYKMAHCSLNPTSPPVQLTEFPPQRASLCPGHGNFEVGGSGSGENYVPCRSPGSFRGGLSWPDRGSVCSPRSSRQPDAFANSLRKYPNMSLERSTEMIERLITYTQAKNLSKTHPNRCQSPSRHGIESNASNPIVADRSVSRNTVTRPCNYQNSYEPEVKIRIRQEDSPTRDARELRGGDCECAEYRRVVKTADRCVNMTKKMKENGRSYSYFLPFQQCASPGIRDRYEHNYSIPGQHTPSLLTATNSVNMEVQAAAEMVSREVATVPRAEPVKRTVAVPLSRTSSSDDQKREGDVSQLPASATNRKSVEASTTIDLSVQTTSSNINASSHQCSCFVARRKSEERLKLEKELSEEIMELLDKVSVCPNADPKACDLRREVLKQMSEKLQKMSENFPVYDEIEKNKDRIGNLLKYVPVWIPSGDVQSYRDAISDEIISKMNHYKTYNEVYRAETQIKMRTDRNTLDDLLHNVIGSMPIKTMDIFGKPVEKNRIVETYVKRLKRLITNISDKTDTSILKPEILVLISKIPIAISTYNKIAYLNKVVDSIITKLKDLNLTEFYFEGLKTKLPCLDRGHEKKKMIDARLKKYVQPTEEELREYISDELNVFLEKHDLQVDNINVVETDLIDILIDSIQDIRLGKDDNVANEIMLLLLQTVEALPDNLAKKFTEKILDNIKQLFNSKTTKVINKPVKIDSQSYILQNPPRCSKEDSESLDKVSDLSIEATPKDGVNANLDEYMNHLMQQIEEWLDNLKVKIPQARDSGFRQVVVNDLAGDIVDRHKYLELNPSSRGTDEDELEHLRYQIFKWINKLAGENNMRTIANASDLMNRIQSIPIPKLGGRQENSYSPSTSKCDPISNRESDGSLPRYRLAGITSVCPDPAKGTVIPKCTSQVLLSTNKSNIRLSMDQTQGNRNGNPATCCSGSVLGPTSPSMKQLNDEYDEFLKKWTEEIPIPSCGPKEKAAADKARQGIYNGVWKAVTKLKFDPATFHNPFYYEDALDDELEELFGMLPNSQELETKKHLLKVQLIEKTTNTNELIKSTSAPASFKQHLVESVYKSLSEITNSDPEGDDARKRHEELQILKLVDNFILCTKYKEEDRSKASVYRNKLIRETQALIDNMKKTHGKELQHINPDSYVNSILIALQKVPLPNEEIIQDEANEILLSHEVDQWFSDLPLAESNADGELQRKMLKDSLVKKVHEIEKEVNIFDCTGERVLKHEISNFLEKLPLQDGANENISFIADEFSNRMKNRAGQLQNNTARKSVAFMDSVGYFEFSRQLPQCSSFSKLPNAKPAVIDQSSLMIRGGSIVKDPYMGARYYGQQDAYEESPKDLPSDQYFTIQDSRYPNPPKQDNRPMQAPENVEWQSIPMATASNIPGTSQQQKSPCCQNAISPKRQSLSGPQATSDQYRQVPPYMSPASINMSQLPPNMILPPQNMGQLPANICHRLPNVSQLPPNMSQLSSNMGQLPSNMSQRPPNISQLPPNMSQLPVNMSQLPVNMTQLPTNMSQLPTNMNQLPPNMSQLRPNMNQIPPNICQQPSNMSQQPPNISQLPPDFNQPPQTMSQGRSQSPCCKNYQENTNRRPSPVMQRSGTPTQMMVDPRNQNQLAVPDFYNVPMSRSNRDVNNISSNGARMNGQAMPSHITYGEPQGFSTPHQVISQGPPPKPGRKRARNMQKNRKDFARRRLDLEDDTEEDIETGDEMCPCERMYRRMRPPLCYFDGFDTDDGQCYPIPYGCPYLY